MKHEKLLTDFDQTVGKTIEAVDFWSSDAWLRFTDGTVIFWTAEADDAAADMLIDTDPDPEDFVSAEVITKEECAQANADKSKQWQAAQEAKERADMERLLQKYPTGGPT